MCFYNELFYDIVFLFYGLMEYLVFLVVLLVLFSWMMCYCVVIFGGLFMVLVVGFDMINEFLLVVDLYSLNVFFCDYLMSYYFCEILSFMGIFISGVCFFGGVDVVYCYVYFKCVVLENYVVFKGFKIFEGFKVLIVGYCVFVVYLGWMIVYYLLGDKFGFWCFLGLDLY